MLAVGQAGSQLVDRKEVKSVVGPKAVFMFSGFTIVHFALFRHSVCNHVCFTVMFH